jgi:hypothetical protein
MTEEMLKTVLETAHAKTDKEGASILPEGRSMTLYAAHDGVPLTVSKIEAVRITHGIIRAKNIKGETFVLAVDDLFAAAIDAGSEVLSARKAGFMTGS